MLTYQSRVKSLRKQRLKKKFKKYIGLLTVAHGDTSFFSIDMVLVTLHMTT